MRYCSNFLLRSNLHEILRSLPFRIRILTSALVDIFKFSNQLVYNNTTLKGGATECSLTDHVKQTITVIMVTKMLLHYMFVLTFLSLVTGDRFAFPCQSPYVQSGFCISIYECPHLQRLLGSTRPAAIETIKSSVCRNWAFKDLMVCCPQTSTPPATTARTTTTTAASKTQQEEDAQKEYALNKLIPSRSYCGLQHTDDRYYNDTETALDEYPWLAHVLFGDENDTSPDEYEFADRCSGVLINNRYVLTNGFCARSPLKVRLGQYNTNETVSCVNNPNFEECTDPWLEIKVEEEIHRSNDIYSDYDFALFRLAKGVIYNDFIRPICLPIRKPGEPEGLQTLTLSGWGADDQKAAVKKRISYTVTNNEDCSKLEQDSPNFSINANIICMNPPNDNKNLVCTGDEGGPLIYAYKHQWFIDAIIGRVYVDVDKESLCAKDKPIAATRITPDVIDWILKNIRK